MSKIVRANADVKAFASNATGTERTIFGEVTQSDLLTDQLSIDFLRGFGIVGANENPTREDFNALGFTSMQFIAYLHQMGVAEWNALQQYQIGGIAGRSNGIYLCKTVDHISATVPESDATNWHPLSVLPATVTGATVFTNSTNNLALTGVGSIGLEIGDVIEVTGTASNNKLFTVEVITDANNIIVNQAHAGGTTTKSLVDETVSCTIKLISKANNAQAGIGQGWVDITASRSLGVTYTNNTGRNIFVSVTSGGGPSGGPSNGLLTVSGVVIANQQATDASVSFAASAIIPVSGTIVLTGPSLQKWTELR